MYRLNLTDSFLAMLQVASQAGGGYFTYGATEMEKSRGGKTAPALEPQNQYSVVKMPGFGTG